MSLPARAVSCPACGNKTFVDSPPRRVQGRPRTALVGAIVGVALALGGGYAYRVHLQKENARKEAELAVARKTQQRHEAELAWGRGNRAVDAGEMQAAVQEYSRSIELSPDYAPAYVSRGSARYAMGEDEKALQDFADAVRVDAGYADAYLARGTLYWMANEASLAEADFRQLVRLRPSDSYFHDRLASVLAAERKDKDVEDLYRAAYEGDPTRNWALEGWLGWYGKNHGNQALLSKLDELPSSATSSAEVLYIKAGALLDAKRFSDAIPVLDLVLKGDPAKVPTSAASSLAYAYREVGRSDACIAALNDYAMRMGRPHLMVYEGEGASSDMGKSPQAYCAQPGGTQ
jgi:tetratricopeptide (TPR) repeat protein